jgi:beta-N-acetylglucosaminidase
MFFTGVIEGFYGRAWTAAQRVEMLDWIAAAGMNTFVYGPKDDIKIRARWRELYDEPEAAELKTLLHAARARGLNLMVAIAPCLDVVYSDYADLGALKRRLDQLLDLDIKQFALLFDDIPQGMVEADVQTFGNLAAAQCHFANSALAHVRTRQPDTHLLFCPTEYCAAFTGHDVPNSAYLNVLGSELDPKIGVFWTGPEIVSETITTASLREVSAVLRRKPVIWENFHANDYDIRRVHAGPLAGRDPDILALIDGFIANPNNEFEANFVPVATTGSFLRGNGPALDEALAAWQPRFRLAFRNEMVPLDALRLLVSLHYQPFQCGPEIEELITLSQRLLGAPREDVSTPHWQKGLARMQGLRERVRNLFETMTELEKRDLFYAFHPYLWEAREEVNHLVNYLEWRATGPAKGTAFPDRDRIHNFYRRGFTVAVQELLPRDRNGRYPHAP